MVNELLKFGLRGDSGDGQYQEPKNTKMFMTGPEKDKEQMKFHTLKSLTPQVHEATDSESREGYMPTLNTTF